MLMTSFEFWLHKNWSKKGNFFLSDRFFVTISKTFQNYKKAYENSYYYTRYSYGCDADSSLSERTLFSWTQRSRQRND